MLRTIWVPDLQGAGGGIRLRGGRDISLQIGGCDSTLNLSTIQGLVRMMLEKIS